MKRLLLALCLVGSALAVLLSGLAAPATGTAKPPDLSVSYLFSGPGHMTKLRASIAYQASQLPLALRLTPPDGSWSGAQWKTRRLGCCGRINGVGNYGGPPFFGWAAVGQGGTDPQIVPRGWILIMTAYAPTPSLAATVTGLRTRGRGTTYDATAPVKLAGFSGIQFDGQLIGPKHLFVPFGAPTHNAHYFPDGIGVEEPGQVFRFIVLNVRGTTVVVFISNGSLPAGQFPAFLTKADRMLKTLKFPA
jgi:hypothetical protein